MIRLGKSGLQLTPDASEIALLQQGFRERHHLRLPGLLDTALLREVQSQLEAASFVYKVHPGIGHELVCWDSPACDSLLFLFNDPRLFQLLTDITGISPIGCFAGRIYRMNEAAGQHDSWHSDAGNHRLIGFSLNLSEQAYRGGTLILREGGLPDTEQLLENTGPGDAVLFRIDPALEHFVSDLEPGPAKTAWAGWFRSEPPFMDILSKKTSF